MHTAASVQYTHAHTHVVCGHAEAGTTIHASTCRYACSIPCMYACSVGNLLYALCYDFRSAAAAHEGENACAQVPLTRMRRAADKSEARQHSAAASPPTSSARTRYRRQEARLTDPLCPAAAARPRRAPTALMSPSTPL